MGKKDKVKKIAEIPVAKDKTIQNIENNIKIWIEEEKTRLFNSAVENLKNEIGKKSQTLTIAFSCLIAVFTLVVTLFVHYCVLHRGVITESLKSYKEEVELLRAELQAKSVK